jgi:hypothetical protein
MNRRDAAKALLAAGAATASTASATGTASAAGTAGSVSTASAASPASAADSANSETRAERAAGVVPNFSVFVGSPRIDPRRYGAVGDGRHDDTQAMQTALAVAQAGNGRVMLPDDCNLLCGPLSLTLRGSSVTQALAIEGASMQSRITVKRATRAPLLTLTSADPRGAPTEAQCILENFALCNPSAQGKERGGHGLQLAGLAMVRVSGVLCLGFDAGLKMTSSLVCLIDQQCQFHSNNTGICIARAGTESNCNLITVDHCRIVGNARQGVDFSGGSQFVMRGCDLEQNGSRGDLSSGAFRSGNDVSEGIGLARIELYENWFEANSGVSVDIRAAPNLQVAIEGGQIISAEQGRALRIEGADGVLIKNVYSPSPGDRWDIECRYLTLINTLVHTLDDAQVAWKDYHNARTSTYTAGGMSRSGSCSVTASGCAGSAPSGLCTYSQNGSQCTLSIPALSGASNSTRFTLSALPAELRPARAQNCAAFIVSGGVAQPGIVTLEPGGEIEFRGPAPGGEFAADGKPKGTPGITITYNLH